MFSPFLIEKVVATRATPQKKVRKTRNGNLPVEVDSRRQPESILKTFHTAKCKEYQREILTLPKELSEVGSWRLL